MILMIMVMMPVMMMILVIMMIMTFTMMMVLLPVVIMILLMITLAMMMMMTFTMMMVMMPPWSLMPPWRRWRPGGRGCAQPSDDGSQHGSLGPSATVWREEGAGGHNDGEGCHNFFYFPSLTKRMKLLCNQEAQFQNNLKSIVHFIFSQKHLFNLVWPIDALLKV